MLAYIPAPLDPMGYTPIIIILNNLIIIPLSSYFHLNKPRIPSRVFFSDHQHRLRADPCGHRRGPASGGSPLPGRRPGSRAGHPRETMGKP